MPHAPAQTSQATKSYKRFLRIKVPRHEVRLPQEPSQIPEYIRHPGPAQHIDHGLRTVVVLELPAGG